MQNLLIKRALIIGGGHGIGFGVVKRLLQLSSNMTLYVSYSNKSRAKPLLELCKHNADRVICFQMDILSEHSIEEELSQLKSTLGHNKLDLCLISSGYLHDEEGGPEKLLKDIDPQRLAKSFLVNSIVTPVIAKHIRSLFSMQQPSIFAAVSAKVGSISDNQLGGWYGYRASKAALNMFIKNIAIEYKRLQLKTIVVSIHPGTTSTELSKPFMSHITHKVWSIDETAEHILTVITQLTDEDTGTFKNWDGTTLPW